MQHELTQRERFLLLALMVHKPPTEIENRDLKECYGFEIKPDERTKLTDAGYLDSVRGRTAGRPYLYELTASGHKRAIEELSGEADPKSAINPRVVYALFNAVHQFLQRNHVPAEAVFNVKQRDTDRDFESPVGDAVIKEYGDLAAEAGAWVPLRALRTALPDIARDELDDALKLLYSRRVIRMTSETNLKTLSEADKKAALIAGGAELHWLAIA